MTCFLCGHDKKGSHHLGCLRIYRPGLTEKEAALLGLIPSPGKAPEPVPDVVEVLKEGTMTTEPVSNACAVDGCDNPKHSDSPRAKYCEEHRDPKNRKE